MKNQVENGLKRLAKEYRSLGLSKTEAKLAAQMEDAVKSIETLPRNLHLAAKSVGMPPRAATALCRPSQIDCT